MVVFFLRGVTLSNAVLVLVVRELLSQWWVTEDVVGSSASAEEL